MIQLVDLPGRRGAGRRHPARRGSRAAGRRSSASAGAAGKFTRVRLHREPHEELHVLVRRDRRRVPDDGHARHRPVDGAALPVRSSSPRQARVALLSSGVVVFAQFVLFLLIGSMLYVYYTRHATAEMAAFTRGRPHPERSDLPALHRRRHLPPGIVGLVHRGVFAAAMSTLSSSLNSSSATAMADFYMPVTPGRATRTTCACRGG